MSDGVSEADPQTGETQALAELEYALDRWRTTGASGGPLHRDAKELVIEAALSVHVARGGRVEDVPDVRP